jgi:hypothetical protein
VPKIVELLDVQLLNGQECLSRYHFFNADGGADEDVLVADYITDVLPLVAAMQTTVTHHVAIRHRQVYPAALLLRETAISPVVSGSNGSAPGPDNASISIKFGIGDTSYLGGGAPPHIRKAGKHLPGVDATHLDEEPLMGSDYDALVAAWFTGVQRPGGADAFALVVVSFELTSSHIVNTHTTRTTTKAVHSPTVTKYAPILTASPPSVSTQNTRKRLRGRTY